MPVLAILGIFVLAVLAIIFFPLFNIWAINTLFGLVIPWTFKTWLASVLLTSMFTGAAFNQKK